MITAKYAHILSTKDNPRIFNRIMRDIKRKAKHHKTFVEYNNGELFDFHRVDYILTHIDLFNYYGYNIESFIGRISGAQYVKILWK